MTLADNQRGKRAETAKDSARNKTADRPGAISIGLLK
jgi:hypothetical protein